MTGSIKRKALILLGLVMIITVIIATSLPQLELQPGMPPPSVDDGQVMIPSGEQEPLVIFPVSDVFKVLFSLFLSGLILYVIYRMIRGIGWRNLGSYIQPIMVITMIVGSILFLILLLPKSQNSIPMELPVPIATPAVTSPLGPVPPLLLWLVGICLLVSSILVGVWIFGSSSSQAKTIDLIGLEAEEAWQALKTGLDLKDVIVKCYRQMSLALEKEQGIEREDFMTTGEFESLLEAAGIPHDPIHQLTRLFDAVRYGKWQPNPIDEKEAIHCLETIMLYSHKAKEMN